MKVGEYGAAPAGPHARNSERWHLPMTAYRKTLLIIASITVAATQAQSQAPVDGWYVHSGPSGCVLNEGGPAGMIRSLESSSIPHRVLDRPDPVSSTIMQVIVEDQLSKRVVIFYRGRGACEAALEAAGARAALRQSGLDQRYSIARAPGSQSANSVETQFIRPDDRLTLARLGWRPAVDLRPGEVAILQHRISECWDVEQAMLGLDPIAVRVAFSVDREGIARQARLLSPSPANVRARAIAAAARRAVLSPNCRPLLPPRASHPDGHSVILLFDQRGAIAP